MNQTETVVKIERIVPNGYGLAFADGLTFFVSLASVGDTVKVRIREKKGKLAFAEIIEIIEPSPDRIEPRCEHFGICGGCDFQQMNYAAQLNAKVGIIKDCLKRIGRIDFAGEIPIIASPNDFEYRSRTQFHADTRDQKIGYFKRHSHQIVDVESCPILLPSLQNKLKDLHENLSWTEFWGEKAEIEIAASGELISTFSAEIIEPTQELTFAAKGDTYAYDAHTFFQGNPYLIDDLIELATANIEGGKALDLYCGVGLFSLPLARKFAKVLGVEGNEKAIEFANKNAANARLGNLEFFNENVGEWVADNRLKDVDFVLLDPPRTGAEGETISNLLKKIKPAKISYVSCDPATLARDLSLLCAESYEIESITAIDLFPQTHHIETVVRLVNRRSTDSV